MAAEPPRVEILTFHGCPGHEAFLPRLRELLGRAGIDAPVQVRRIESVETAERERFLGSPTLQIDGEDVGPTAAARPGRPQTSERRELMPAWRGAELARTSRGD